MEPKSQLTNLITIKGNRLLKIWYEKRNDKTANKIFQFAS
jgi:hypothetical protein